MPGEEPLPSKEELFQTLRRLLEAEFEIPAHEVTWEAHLGDDLDLDSVDAVALAVRLEEDTGLTLDEDDLRAMLTVQHVVDLVHDRLREERAPGS